MPKSVLLQTIEKVEQNLARLKNCGIGSGGFQPGNSCARGGGGASAVRPVEAGSYKGGVPHVPSSVFKGKKANEKGYDTMEQYATGINKNGKPTGFTKERQALHDEIIKKHIDQATPVKNPVSYMMGGGPASGKSTSVDSGHIKLPDNRVEINADHIKGMLPEYKHLTGVKDERAAGFAHEESSYLSRKIIDAAVAKGCNLNLDGTGDSGIESLTKKVKQMRTGGRTVKASYVTLDTNLAVKIEGIRAQKTGRKVNQGFLRHAHKKVSQIVPDAIKKGLFDEFDLYDNNIKGVSRPVASAKKGELVIHDKKLWNDFLAKGK